MLGFVLMMIREMFKKEFPEEWEAIDRNLEIEDDIPTTANDDKEVSNPIPQIDNIAINT